MNSLIKKLISIYNFEYIVTDYSIYKFMEKEINFENSRCNLKVINDLRSATFFCMGKVQHLRKNMLLITDKDTISNCYTALLEAWFQKTPLFVLVLLDLDEQLDSLYDRCFNRQIEITNNSEYLYLEEKIKGPTLIKIRGDYNRNSKYYNENLNKIVEEIDDENCEIQISKNLDSSENYLEKVSYTNGGYGVISKYIGELMTMKNNVYLICSMEELKLDLNILNFQYIPNRFKLIVLSEYYNEDSLKEWILENNFNFFEGKEEIKKFCSSKGKSIIFVR